MPVPSFASWSQNSSSTTPSQPTGGTLPTPTTPTGIPSLKQWSGGTVSVPTTSQGLLPKLFPTTAQGIHELGIDPLSLKANPRNAINDWWNTIKGSVEKAGNEFADAFSKYSSTPSKSGRVGSFLKGVASTGGAVISPISGLFEAANDIPILGTASRGVGLAFAVLGDAGRDVGQGVVDVLPLDKTVKANVREGVGDIFSLAAQIYGGGKLSEVAPKVKEGLIKKYGTKDAETIINQATKMANDKIAHERDTTAGPAPVEVATPRPEGIPVAPTATEALQIAKEKIATDVPLLEQTVVEPSANVSKIAKSIETKAIESGLTKGFSDLAGYDKITIKDQAQRASNLISSDIEIAKSILKGEKELPEGLKGTALIKAFEDHLIKNPDADLAYDLANSKLVTGTSTAAQELRLAAERDPDSVASKIIEIKKARETKSGKLKSEKATKTAKKIVEETKKVNLDKVDLLWDNFLDSIAC